MQKLVSQLLHLTLYFPMCSAASGVSGFPKLSLCPFTGSPGSNISLFLHFGQEIVVMSPVRASTSFFSLSSISPFDKYCFVIRGSTTCPQSGQFWLPPSLIAFIALVLKHSRHILWLQPRVTFCGFWSKSFPHPLHLGVIFEGVCDEICYGICWAGYSGLFYSYGVLW